MYQILNKSILTDLNIEIPVMDNPSFVATEFTQYQGNLGGTEDQDAFYCKGALEGNAETKPFGIFTGSPVIQTFKQVTPKLFVFNLSVYSKGYNQYNVRLLSCKCTGRTAELISAISDKNQVLVVQGELGIEKYTLKVSGEEMCKLNLFVQNFNYAGTKQPKQMAFVESFSLF